MDFSRFLSINDFFNYYITGIFWIADIFLLIYMINNSFLNPLWDSSCKLLASGSFSWIQPVLDIIIIIILPYTAGFVLGTLSQKTTKKFRDCKGDPIKYIICLKDIMPEFGCDKKECIVDNCNKDCNYGKKLPYPAIKRILEIAPSLFCYKLKYKCLWFYQIRAYVVDKGGPAAGLAERAQNLANFTESLMLSFPIFCAIVTCIIITELHIISCVFAVLVAGLSGIFTFIILFERYMELRRDWAMHIYREFLVITADKNDDMSYI